MARYPRQVDREYLSCRSGGLDKIQMIDGGTPDLHQDLVTCDRRRRYIVEHQLPTVFEQPDSFHESSPSLSLPPVRHARAPERRPPLRVIVDSYKAGPPMLAGSEWPTLGRIREGCVVKP